MTASFSEKQLRAMTWWMPKSRDHGFDALVCDGAVRSGKTLAMGLGFFLWAMSCFTGRRFALCGKTRGGVRRNVVQELLPWLRRLGMTVSENRTAQVLRVRFAKRENEFYLFGGKDEGSAALIQGMTLGGVLLDEVALMPRSFVEQALARCSLDGSKLWFNCNPDTPLHWFYEEWIKKSGEKNCLYLHFTMDDNPSLTPAIKRRYESLYSGAFYDRFVLGKWVAAQGLVYPFFSRSVHVAEPAGIPSRYFISCDYGTVNPSSFGLWGEYGGRWYRLSEYYFDSRREGEQRTDEEHYASLEQLAGDLNIEAVIADPSAASFLECIRRHGRFRAVPAKNDVIDGIRRVSDALKERRILFSQSCTDCLREFSLYRWDNTAARDAPRKEYDHAMDDVRYFVSTVLAHEEDGFFALAMSR